ncbi:MAG: SOS response-associated peptidase [Burkholderiales bacterium]|nr:MAG: SOS response-associated peptidase [Burkholderiales bacterium]
MCNHYRQAILKGERIPGWSIDQFSEIRIPLRFSNLPEQVYPDKFGVVFRQQGDGLEASSMRWGFPKTGEKRDWGTNARNIFEPSGELSRWWGPWTYPENRCLVPATSFFEPDQSTVGTGAFREVEFARADGLPFMFAGLWQTWSGVRGTKKSPETGEHDLYTFLTTEPNAVVKPFHKRAMPVMLTTWEQCEIWLNEPIDEAIKLQKPLREDGLMILPREPST